MLTLKPIQIYPAFCATPARTGQALSLKGAGHLGSDLTYGPINRNVLEHEVLLGDIRLALEQAGVAAMWRPGHELRRHQQGLRVHRGKWNAVLPDAIFAAKTRLGHYPTFALELELHPKAKSRYRKILEIYREKQGLLKIWYVVPHERLGKLLLEVWQSLSPRHNEINLFAWSSLDQVISDPFNITLHSATKTEKLRSLIEMRSPEFVTQPAQGFAHPVSIEAKNQFDQKSALVLEKTEVVERPRGHLVKLWDSDNSGGVRGSHMNSLSNFNTDDIEV